MWVVCVTERSKLSNVEENVIMKNSCWKCRLLPSHKMCLMKRFKTDQLKVKNRRSRMEQKHLM